MATSAHRSKEVALQTLLSDDLPHDDLATLDLLYTCWPRQTENSHDPHLVAVARRLTRSFGRIGRLPLSSSRAWRMINARDYAEDLADQLTFIIEFVNNWHKHSQDFLILEVFEIDLIEYLFESLDIGRYGPLLAKVMGIKALSMRRAGLLRRVPPRVERQNVALIEAGRADLAVAELEKTRLFLEHFIVPVGFAPIIDAAKRAAERVSKDIAALAAAADSAHIGMDNLIE